MNNEKTCDNCGQQELERCIDCKMVKNHICVSGVCHQSIEPSEWVQGMEDSVDE